MRAKVKTGPGRQGIEPKCFYQELGLCVFVSDNSLSSS